MVLLSLKDEIGGQVWSRLYNRACWEGVRFPVGRIYEDLAISFYPFLKARKPIGFLDVPLYSYRLNPKGISLTKNPLKSYHIFLGFKEHYEYAKINAREAQSCCLSKAVSHGLGAYGVLMYESESIYHEQLNEIRAWIKKNKKEIIGCNDINVVRKVLTLMLIYTKWVFRLLNLTYRKFKHQNVIGD